MYDHDGYEPFNPNLTPRSLAAAGRSQDPPPAPQRERSQMVAPGPGVPTPADQEQVSRHLWERLEYQPIAGTPTRLASAYTPNESLGRMDADTQSMWSHIGQGVSINLHPSPGLGAQGRNPQLQRRPLVTPELGGARPDAEEAAQLSRAEAMTRPAALSRPSNSCAAATPSGYNGANTNTYNLGSMAHTSDCLLYTSPSPRD